MQMVFWSNLGLISVMIWKNTAEVNSLQHEISWLIKLNYDSQSRFFVIMIWCKELWRNTWPKLFSAKHNDSAGTFYFGCFTIRFCFPFRVTNDSLLAKHAVTWNTLCLQRNNSIRWATSQQTWNQLQMMLIWISNLKVNFFFIFSLT